MEAYSVIWNIVLQCLVVALGSVLLAFFAWAIFMAIIVFLAEKQTRKMKEERNNKRV